ncbi:tape measure protein [Paremcibacter congregatus]|uniref:tape measure protein n=1 Tax=Paremcibacter congregatus TaxID=2043170 RepID=UPI003A9127FA
MATVADLLVRIEANTQQMRNELRKGEGIVNRFDKNVSRAALSSSTALERVGKTARATIGILAGLGVGLGIAEIATGIAQVNAQFQDLQTSLKVATGSASAADKAFEGLRVFAKETPFQLSEVTQAFISLKNLGLDPSMDALRAYGDIASSFNGKSLDDFIQAVADATTGEFERLKEFGIKASSEGDKVAFTFRGLTTTIGKNAAEIERYLQDLARNNFGGAMSEKMDNLSGRFSNLKDQIDDLYVPLGESGGIDVMAAALDLASASVEGLSNNLGVVADTIALVGIAASGRFMAPMIASMGASVVATRAAIAETLRYQATLASMAGVSRSAAVGMTALGVAARGASGAMAFLGGPIGAAITVLGGAVYYLSTRQSDAEKSAIEHRDALERLSLALGDGTDLSTKAADAARVEAKARISAALATLEQLEAQRKVNAVAEQMAAEAPIQSPSDPKLDLTSGLDKRIDEQRKRLEEYRHVLGQLNGEIAVTKPLDEVITSGGSGSNKEADKIQAVIESLDFQRGQLTRTTREQAVYNAMQQAGISSSHAMASSIRSAALAYYDAADAVDVLKEKTAAEDKARADIAGTIADLERENTLLQVQGIERDKLRAILEAEATAREGGISLSEKERGQIEGLIEANGRLVKAEEDAAEAARDAREFARDFGNVISSSFEDAILSGEKFGDILKSLEQDIARIILRMAVTKPLENAATGFDWGGLFTSIGTSLFGGGAATSGPGISYPAGSTFANGGIMTAQGEVPLRKYSSGGVATSPQLALFGEGSKPEAYVPLPDGRNIPVKIEGGTGESFTYAPTIMVDATGSKMSRDEIRSIVKTSVDQSVAEVRNLQKRKGNARI